MEEEKFWIKAEKRKLQEVMEDAESKTFLESSLCLMALSHGNMAENSAFQKGNQCLFCVAEESFKSDYRK